MKAEFHPDAAQELAAAVQMYESSLTGLGADLRVEVMRITSLLCRTPELVSRWTNGTGAFRYGVSHTD